MRERELLLALREFLLALIIVLLLFLLLFEFGCVPNQNDLNDYYNTVIVNQINYDTEIDSLYNIYVKYDFSNDIFQLDKIIKQIYDDKIDSMLNELDTLYKPIDVDSLFLY